jgi:hypothetical protein
VDRRRGGDGNERPHKAASPTTRRATRVGLRGTGARVELGSPATVAEVPMTQQYIVGEFSCLVAELEPAAGELEGVVHSLRQEIEASPLCGLPGLAREVLNLADRVCWVALEQGDVASFRHCAETAAVVREFTVSANLLP